MRVWPVLGLFVATPFVTVAVGQQQTDDSELYRLALLAVTPGVSPTHPVALSDTTMDLSKMWKEAEETAAQQPYLHPRTRITYAKGETVEAFLNASARRLRLPRVMARVPGVLVLTESQLRRAPRDAVGALHDSRGRPLSTASVSAIGFDETRTEALIWVDWYCGSLCGSGTFVLLVREGQKWRVEKVDHYFVS